MSELEKAYLEYKEQYETDSNYVEIERIKPLAKKYALSLWELKEHIRQREKRKNK